MTIYYKSDKLNAEPDLKQGSKFAYQVSRPDGLNGDDVTRLFFPIIKHLTRNEYAVAVPEMIIHIHPAVKLAVQESGNFPEQKIFIGDDADSDRILNILAGDADVTLADIIPARWIEVTLEQLTTDGWFDFPEDQLPIELR